MPDEPRIVISTEPTLGAEEVARRTFATSFRGYDPGEVRGFLQRVADELAAARDRERELRRRLDDVERRTVSLDLDEATLTAALGAETARVLRSAREAAADITAKAEDKVARRVLEAEEEAARVRGEAEAIRGQRTQEAEEAAAEIRRAAEADGEAIRARGRADAQAEIDAARVGGREMLSEAQALREKVLSDLARRRRVAAAQVEQLRAGRERLLDAYRVVKRTLDEVFDELGTAEVEARAAAEAAGRRAAAEAELTLDELEAELSAARAAALVGGSPSETPSRPGAEGAAATGAGQPRVRRRTSAQPEGGGGGGSRAGGSERPGSVSLDQAASDTSSSSVSPTSPMSSEPSPPSGMSPSTPPAVDELFAQMRADREQAVAHAHAVLGAGSSQSELGVEVAGAQDIRAGATDVSIIPTTDEVMLQRRDELLEPVDAALMRRLKRTLQDDQNAVLDTVRRLPGDPSLEAVLPPLDQHLGRYRGVAERQLEQAAQAGVVFAGGDRAQAGEHAVGDANRLAEVSQLADQLASDLVVPLRERLGRGFEEAAASPGDETLLIDRMSVAYREWKLHRLEPLARHAVATAFGRAAFGATGDAALLQWVVDDDGGPCPDCDDNVLAGALPKGEPFPTGQLHPPAHPGCRCVLVRSPR